jgi:hypothetical protein
MITAAHLAVLDDYLRDLKDAVITVRMHPELAQSGSAASYGMMSHIPLRGLVRSKVLDMFAQMYKAGGQELDLHAPHEPASGLKSATKSLLERLLLWYVTRQQQKEIRRG